MLSSGIDIGSRTIELVVLNGNRIVTRKETEVKCDPMRRVNDLLAGVAYDCIVVTGYGRHLFEVTFDVPTVTEIKAYAVGVAVLIPNARSILDIGGQDSKAIAVSSRGKVIKFEMNDRCAAGTGKFLEVIAYSLGYSLEEFDREALKAGRELRISNMCTVFAESEVTSLLARGEDRANIAMGLHRSVVRRAAGMLKRVSLETPIVFAGGVARNVCIRKLLVEELGKEVKVPDHPHMVGAYGAALIARHNEGSL